MNVNFFTPHPFSVDYNSKRYDLSKEDKIKIAIAAIVGAAFLGIGSVIAFLGASYYFRMKKVEELSKEDDPTLQRIDEIATPIISPVSSPIPEPKLDGKQGKTGQTIHLNELSQQFAEEIDQKMGAFLTLLQEKTLMALFDEAMQSPQPKKKFEELVTSQINQPNGWSEDKAGHIKTHLFSLLPDNLDVSKVIKSKGKTPKSSVQNQLREEFSQRIDDTMEKHITLIQKQKLLKLFDEAMKKTHPRQSLEQLIDDLNNFEWGMDKSHYIKSNLLDLMPVTTSVHQSKSPQVASVDTLQPQSINWIAIRKDYQKQLDAMGAHLNPTQRKALEEIFEQAIQHDQPRTVLSYLIENRSLSALNPEPNWGAAKADILKANLLPILPDEVKQPMTQKMLNSASLQIKQIVQTYQNFLSFYKIGPTEFLGNFAICPHGIQVWGKTFLCSESAFQWFKFHQAAIDNNRQDLLDDPMLDKFFTCTGEEAFQLRKYLDTQYPKVFANNWQNGVRDQVMWDILNAKFSQNPEFKFLLQVTGKTYLLEHNEKSGRDIYWSDDHNGTGQNMLGKMLRSIRDDLPCPVPSDADLAQRIAFAKISNTNLNYKIY